MCHNNIRPAVSIPVQPGHGPPEVSRCKVVTHSLTIKFSESGRSQVLMAGWCHSKRDSVFQVIVKVSVGNNQITVTVKIAIQKLSTPPQTTVRGFMETGSLRLIHEAGFVVSFILDGDCLPVREKHQAFKAALKRAEGEREAAEALQAALIENERALQKYARR